MKIEITKIAKESPSETRNQLYEDFVECAVLEACAETEVVEISSSVHLDAGMKIAIVKKETLKRFLQSSKAAAATKEVA